MPNNYNQDIERLAETERNDGMDNWEVIVKYSGDVRKIETDLGAEIDDLGEGYAIIRLRGNQISMLDNYKEILYIELPKTLTLMLNQSLRTSCVSAVQSADGYNLTGEGMLIGIVDSGIDYTHPDFRNADGTSRVVYLWDQTANGSPPYGFRHGAEYDSRQINTALTSPRPYEIVPSDDSLGHGTAVAGIAAGNGRSSGGREKGAAPEASLIIVKLGYRGFESFARTTEIMRALKYLTEKAEELGMPVAINISYGTNDGSHDGSSLFETYINAFAQKWKSVIVVAMGNEGAASHHFSGEIAEAQTVDVKFSITQSLDFFYLTLWKHFSDRFTFELIMPGGETTGVINPSRKFTEMTINGAALRVYYGQPTHYNEDQEIYIRAERRTASIPHGSWRLLVSGEEVVDGRFDIWLPTTEEVGNGTVFSEPSPDTTLTLPSTAKNVISVGGYNGAIDAAIRFSGRGFTRNNVYAKPDLVAPAVGIISARAGGGYDSFTGTSMAAPFVTGAAALMMQWGIVLGNDPSLYGQRVKAFLKKGAKKKSTLNYPNSYWGFGTLCLKDSMDYLIYNL